MGMKNYAKSPARVAPVYVAVSLFTRTHPTLWPRGTERRSVSIPFGKLLVRCKRLSFLAAVSSHGQPVSAEFSFSIHPSSGVIIFPLFHRCILLPPSLRPLLRWCFPPSFIIVFILPLVCMLSAKCHLTIPSLRACDHLQSCPFVQYGALHPLFPHSPMTCVCPDFYCHDLPRHLP